MTYSTVNQAANDQALIARINAAIAQEQKGKAQPIQPGALIDQMRWAVASASDVEAAYASALASLNPNPGADESVITDGMILANVQAYWPQT